MQWNFTCPEVCCHGLYLGGSIFRFHQSEHRISWLWTNESGLLCLAVTEDNELVTSRPGDVPGLAVSVQISLLALLQVGDLHVAVIVEQGGQVLVCTEARISSVLSGS